MKWLGAILGFLLASTMEVSVSQGAVDNPANQKAATAFRLFTACASKITEDAPFDRCLKSTMTPDASRFDEMKATEFLNLGLKVSSIGTCPKATKEAHDQRRRETKLTLEYACFFVSLENSERGLSGEVEFTPMKNGELKVRRVRYSF